MSGRPGLSSRLASAALALAVNLLFWFIVPYYLLGSLEQSSSGIPLTYGLIYVFGATITAIEVVAALTKGTAVATIFNAGGSLATAFYIYLSTGGGDLSITSSGVTVDLSFPVLLTLILLPPMFNALRLGISYLLDESEGSRPMLDEVRG
jgi:hypothetical protein